jgi:hypothetical protein
MINKDTKRKIYDFFNRNKLIHGCFLVVFLFNYFYGPLLYSKIFGLEYEYMVGQECSISRTVCERTYFEDLLGEVIFESSAPRSHFSDIVIKEDQRGYEGNCPCPDDLDSRGGSCGGRSSYSKGGVISFCFDRDVSDERIAQTKAEQMRIAQNNLDSAVQSYIDVYREKYTLLAILILYLGSLYYKHNNNRTRSSS